MMKKVLLILGFSLSLSLSAQVTIEECYEKARNNYPLVKQYDLITISEKYSLQNASRVYIPQFSINGSATYQTQVLEFPFEIPGIDIPEFSKDQYSAYLEMTQLIWDGGAVSAQRKNIRAQGDVSRESYNVDMYKIKERINDLFFGVLLVREQISQVELYLSDLQTTLEKVKGCVENGVANRSDEDVIRVEQLTTGQRKLNLESTRDAYLDMLSIMIGEKLSDASLLVMPDFSGVSSPEAFLKLSLSENHRPELALFSAQSQELLSRKQFVNSTVLPQFGLFIRGAYGLPGLNFFNNDFSAYAIGGVKLTWNFGGLYTMKNEKRIIETGRQQIDLMRETFLFNTSLSTVRESAEIAKYVKIMKDDDNIIALRESIRLSTETAMSQGMKNATDLMLEINREEVAKQEKILHQIQCLKSIYELKTSINK